MHDLGRHRRPVDGFRRRAEVARPARRCRGRSGRRERLHLPADRDSHVGFDKPANPDALDTLQEAIGKVKALPASARLHDPHRRHHPSVEAPRSSTMPSQIIGGAGLDVTTCPASTTCSMTATARPTSTATARNAKGAGWYSFDQNGVHFIGLVNVVDLKAGGLGNLGAEQLAWLADDLAGLSSSTPIVVFAHIPLWTVYPQWGWGTDDSAQALDAAEAVRLGDGAQRPHPPDHAEGRGQRHLPHRPLDRLPAAGARHSAVARADEGAGRRPCAAISASPMSPSRSARPSWR